MSPVVPFEFDPRNDGYWGDTTSTLDWCEANYEVTTTLNTAAFSWLKAPTSPSGALSEIEKLGHALTYGQWAYGRVIVH